MPEFDQNYMTRTGWLFKDARENAFSNWKFTPATRAYFNGETAARVFGAAAGSVLSGTVAQACAGALVGAGLVGAGAATFGIAPAIGVVLTYGFLKGIAEAKYQAKNNSLKKDIAMDEDGESLTIKDGNQLCALIAKVLKKYERVQRAAAQAGAFGTTARVTSTVRHPRTAARGLAKNLVEAKTYKQFPGVTYNDHELSDRLYELQFYGQMLFNFVEKITDKVAVPIRNNVAYACTFIYAHVVRQVHFMGNHKRCKTRCYSMRKDEYNARLGELGLAASFDFDKDDYFDKDAFADNAYDGQRAFLRAGDGMGKVGGSKSRYVVKGQLGQGLAKLQRSEGTSSHQKKNWNDHILKGMFRGAVSSQGVVAGVERFNAAEMHFSWLNAEEVATCAGAAAHGAHAAGQTAGFGVAFAELARTITNRLTKRSVLEPGRQVGAFNLLQEENWAREQALNEFRGLLANHDVVSRAPRVGEKIIWYCKKMMKIRDDFDHYYKPALMGTNFDRSVFDTCDDAFNLVYNAFYFFKTCEKLIAFLVYLEVILLQIDLLVSKIPNIGIGVGAIIKPGERTPAKPETVKGFGAEWDKQKSILPWK